MFKYCVCSEHSYKKEPSAINKNAKPFFKAVRNHSAISRTAINSNIVWQLAWSETTKIARRLVLSRRKLKNSKRSIMTEAEEKEGKKVCQGRWGRDAQSAGSAGADADKRDFICMDAANIHVVHCTVPCATEDSSLLCACANSWLPTHKQLRAGTQTAESTSD